MDRDINHSIPLYICIDNVEFVSFATHSQTCRAVIVHRTRYDVETIPIKIRACEVDDLETVTRVECNDRVVFWDLEERGHGVGGVGGVHVGHPIREQTVLKIPSSEEAWLIL